MSRSLATTILGDELLIALAVDAGVNQGRGWTSRARQQIAGVMPDGRLGPQSLSAIHRLPPASIYREILVMRAERYGQTITADLSQSHNAASWMNRLAEFIRLA